MTEFPSLREFLSLKDPTAQYPRSSHRSNILDDRNSKAEDLLARCDIAKKSWECYGDNGPETGTKVRMLCSGHGGGVNAIRTFEGVYGPGHRFFKVSMPRALDSFVENDDGKDYSIVERSQWWLHMQVCEA